MPHTADVILEAWGPDLASCCEEAVAALVGTFVARTEGGIVGEHRTRLSSEPEESLLLDVLEEVIFTLDTAEEVPVGADIRSTHDGGLDVVLRLAERTTLEATGAVPKAVSRSGLRVDVEPGQIFCRFLVDL